MYTRRILADCAMCQIKTVKNGEQNASQKIFYFSCAVQTSGLFNEFFLVWLTSQLRSQPQRIVWNLSLSFSLYVYFSLFLYPLSSLLNWCYSFSQLLRHISWNLHLFAPNFKHKTKSSTNIHRICNKSKQSSGVRSSYVAYYIWDQRTHPIWHHLAKHDLAN